jgi:hypothetical protein
MAVTQIAKGKYFDKNIRRVANLKVGNGLKFVAFFGNFGCT